MLYRCLRRLALALAVLALAVGGNAHAVSGVGAAGLWFPVAPLGQTGRVVAARTLPDGQVLVIGEAVRPAVTEPGVTFPMTAERYDAVADRWIAVSPPQALRTIEATLLLPDGQLLARGGTGGSPSAMVMERYDPSADRWTPVA